MLEKISVRFLMPFCNRRWRRRLSEKCDFDYIQAEWAEAERAASEICLVDPTLRLSNLRERFPMARQEDFSRWEEGLRKAGLPD
jgi:hypothetical protein